MTLDLLHEFANTEMFGLFHNCMWQSRHPQVDVYFLTLCEQIDGLFTVNGSSTFSSASLSLSERSTDKLVLSQPSKKRVSISWALERDVCSVVTGRPVLRIGFGVFGWVGWELSACPATSEPNSFIQLSLKEIFGGGRGDAYTFSYYDFPSFHLDSLRDTTSWERAVKDDGVRSRLIEL